MTEISQELAQDLETLVREFAASNLQGHFAQRARVIVAKMPPPFHPDVLEARKICAVVYPDSAEQYLSGLNDTFPLMRGTEAGIRRGKALGRQDNLGGGGI